jgi:PTS system nitrogen regulatory IIA component
MNRIAAALTPTRIRLDSRATSKEQLLQEAGRLFCTYEGWAPEEIATNLIAREAIGSTGLGHAFALPHARLKGLRHAVAAFLRVELALDFGAPDGKPVSDFLVILVPENAGEAHLQMLAQAVGLFGERAFRDHLRQQTNPTAILHAFATWPAG